MPLIQNIYKAVVIVWLAVLTIVVGIMLARMNTELTHTLQQQTERAPDPLAAPAATPPIEPTGDRMPVNDNAATARPRTRQQAAAAVNNPANAGSSTPPGVASPPAPARNAPAADTRSAKVIAPCPQPGQIQGDMVCSTAGWIYFRKPQTASQPQP